jgi:hypothetical protein
MEEIIKKVIEKPLTAIIFIICLTIFGVALVYGGVACNKQDNEYRLKMYGKWPYEER